MSPILLHIIIVVLVMTLVAFFAGVEIAFLASSLVKIELRTRQGSVAAKILSYFKKNTSKVLITILIGNNIALVLYTLQIDFFFEHFYHQATGYAPPENDLFFTLLKSVIDTMLLLVIAEYIPKAVFRRLADTVIYPSAYLLQFFYILFYPLVILANAMTKLLLKIMRIPFDDQVVGIEKQDLENYIQEIIDTSEPIAMEELDTDVLSNAITLNDTRVREMMIPRTEIVAISNEDDIQDLTRLFIETKHSRIMVYEDNLDQIIGYVHSTHVFRKPREFLSLIQQVLIVPEVMSANMLLKEFADKKRSVAIVVDEYGGTAGMITVEDVMEQVFGDIQDEHDEEESESEEEDMVFTKSEDGTMIIGARLNIYDLREEHDLILPESEHYTTLGGYILHETEEIPPVGAVLDKIDKNYLFRVLKATPTKIIQVKAEPKSDMPDEN
ncbi:MAG: hemolysin family protein [Bacteroidia bacterium]|nr:hemolysin family protein [Bacteroidia bacterium]